MEDRTSIAAALLAAARAINLKAREYPQEAAVYFNAAFNTVLDVTPASAVWILQIIKFEERFDQHQQDCQDCKSGLDCPVATKLKSKILVYRARLAEEEWKTQS
jgi:hypothetical protein